MRTKQPSQHAASPRRDANARKRAEEARFDASIASNAAGSNRTVASGVKLSAAQAPIKMGDKLYLVTRRDIAPGYQAVQSCHAMRQFTAEHPDCDAAWYASSNFLALLSVANEIELMRLLTQASDAGLLWSAFREPDVGGRITAIALQPSKLSAELCKGLPLALKELA